MFTDRHTIFGMKESEALKMRDLSKLEKWNELDSPIQNSTRGIPGDLYGGYSLL